MQCIHIDIYINEYIIIYYLNIYHWSILFPLKSHFYQQPNTQPFNHQRLPQPKDGPIKSSASAASASRCLTWGVVGSATEGSFVTGSWLRWTRRRFGSGGLRDPDQTIFFSNTVGCRVLGGGWCCESSGFFLLGFLQMISFGVFFWGRRSPMILRNYIYIYIF